MPHQGIRSVVARLRGRSRRKLERMTGTEEREGPVKPRGHGPAHAAVMRAVANKRPGMNQGYRRYAATRRPLGGY